MRNYSQYLSMALVLTSLASIEAQVPIPKIKRKATDVLEKKVEELNQPEKTKDSNKKVEQTTDTTVAAKEKPAQNSDGLQSYSKFDFVPGEKVIFYEDFSETSIGDFPVAWNTNGSAEVVTTNLFEGKWMKFSSRDAVWTDGLLDLPENYTIEFDVIPIKGNEGGMAGYHFRLMQSINAKSFDHGAVPGKAAFAFNVEYYGRPGYRTYINSEEGNDLGLGGFKDDRTYYQVQDKRYHISIWAQKSRIRLYQNENKLFDLPRAFPLASVKMDRIRFEDGAAMVTNIRVAVGAPDMRSKLITEGKLISYGIYFDANKDVIKPESFGTLKEISAVLTENADVHIKIIGHTDSDGADAANLDLSKRRALSVKNALINSFGISSSRIDTDGEGESKPIAPNDSPSNKALNRRVEFLKN